MSLGIPPLLPVHAILPNRMSCSLWLRGAVISTTFVIPLLIKPGSVIAECELQSSNPPRLMHFAPRGLVHWWDGGVPTSCTVWADAVRHTRTLHRWFAKIQRPSSKLLDNFPCLFASFPPHPKSHAVRPGLWLPPTHKNTPLSLGGS